jgi:hypothetical protein
MPEDPNGNRDIGLLYAILGLVVTAAVFGGGGIILGFSLAPNPSELRGKLASKKQVLDQKTQRVNSLVDKVERLQETSRLERKDHSEQTPSKAVSSKRHVLGRWKDWRRAIDATWMIYRENRKYWLKREFSDGTSDKKRLHVRHLGVQKTFEEVDARYGEFLVVTEVGTLEVHDQEGLIATMRRVGR